MKNQKGFTLIELLAVVVILAIIVTIAVPSTMTISKRLKTKMFCTKMDFIENAAKLYGEDRKDSFTALYEGNKSRNITVLDLVKNNYLKKDNTSAPYIEDPRDKNNNLDELKLTIYVQNNGINVSFNDADKTINEKCKKNTHNMEDNDPTLDVKVNSNEYIIGSNYIYVGYDLNKTSTILSKLNISNGNAFIKDGAGVVTVTNNKGDIIKKYNIVGLISESPGLDYPVAGGSSIEVFLSQISRTTGCEIYILRNTNDSQKRLVTGSIESGDKLGIYYNEEKLEEISLNIRW